MRFVDALMAFPSILLAIFIIALLGSGLVNMMIAIGISAIPWYARTARGSTLSVKESMYAEAARAIGAPSWRIVAFHILPNIFAPILILGTLGTATAILAVAGLSFLGLGAHPPTPEWGAMLSGARNYIGVSTWYSVFPGLAILVSVLSINLIGDALRDLLDPRPERGCQQWALGGCVFYPPWGRTLCTTVDTRLAKAPRGRAGLV